MVETRPAAAGVYAGGASRYAPELNTRRADR
jgi:hypothetical protein